MLIRCYPGPEVGGLLPTGIWAVPSAGLCGDDHGHLDIIRLIIAFFCLYLTLRSGKDRSRRLYQVQFAARARLVTCIRHSAKGEREAA
jgi:hypothetical protein